MVSNASQRHTVISSLKAHSEEVGDAYGVNANVSQCILDSNKGPTDQLLHYPSWKICKHRQTV